MIGFWGWFVVIVLGLLLLAVFLFFAAIGMVLTKALMNAFQRSQIPSKGKKK